MSRHPASLCSPLARPRTASTTLGRGLQRWQQHCGARRRAAVAAPCAWPPLAPWARGQLKLQTELLPRACALPLAALSAAAETGLLLLLQSTSLSAVRLKLTLLAKLIIGWPTRVVDLRTRAALYAILSACERAGTVQCCLRPAGHTVSSGWLDGAGLCSVFLHSRGPPRRADPEMRGELLLTSEW